MNFGKIKLTWRLETIVNRTNYRTEHHCPIAYDRTQRNHRNVRCVAVVTVFFQTCREKESDVGWIGSERKTIDWLYQIKSKFMEGVQVERDF